MVEPPVAEGGRRSAGRDVRGRRRAIVTALRRCMMANGYAETSLTELAEAAGMSVSHLLYYYAGKEAVLGDLCDQVFDRIVEDVYANKDDPPPARIRGLVANLFIRGAVVRSELPIVRELGALAIHRPEIRARTEAYGRKMQAYLEDLFEQSPRQPGVPAADAAKIAGALWSGFVNNVEFDKRLSAPKARELFRKTLFLLAGLPLPARGPADIPVSADRAADL